MKDDLLDVGCAVIFHEGRLLISKRHEHDSLGGHWEFPGGKQEEGETIEECLVREVKEELDVVIRPVRLLTLTEHHYADYSLRLHFYLCAFESGTPSPVDCAEVEWVEPEDLYQYRFPPADREIIENLMKKSGKFILEDESEEDGEG